MADQSKNIYVHIYIYVFSGNLMDQLGQNLINKNLDFTRFCGMTDPGTLGSCGGESKKKNKKLLRVYPNSHTNVTPEGPGL